MANHNCHAGLKNTPGIWCGLGSASRLCFAVNSRFVVILESAIITQYSLCLHNYYSRNDLYFHVGVSHIL